MYQATETATETLYENWIRENEDQAIITLVDNAMDSYPFPQTGIVDKSFALRMELDGLFRRMLTAEQRIEWASKLSDYVWNFDEYCEEQADY